MTAFWVRRPDPEPEPPPASDAAGPDRNLRAIRAYHERTKHGFHRFAAGPLDLDWANQPEPFRRFDGAELVELEVFAAAEVDVAYDRTLVAGGIPPAPLDRSSISRLFFDALAISAWKQFEEARWALRINPSSGNLHPTEAYLVAPALAGIWARPSVLHYAPREHALELRAELPEDLARGLFGAVDPADAGAHEGSLLVGLTSIAWREAWKYGERAYRYCQHDIGHAIGALRIAAAGLGWSLEVADGWSTDDVAVLLGVADSVGPEAERAEVLLRVRPTAEKPVAARVPPVGLDALTAALAWRGRPNELSAAHVEWGVIEAAFEATKQPRVHVVERTPATDPRQARGHAGHDGPRDSERDGPGASVLPERPDLGLRAIVRQRRSCQTLDGRTSLGRAGFLRLLESVLPRPGRVPFDSMSGPARLDLAIFVHRVDDLHPGLYWLARDPERLERARAALRPEFLWETPPGCAAELPLALLLPLDLRRQATDVSCQQAIAGDGVFSLGMLAEYEGALAGGAWNYPRLFWEAGLVGQRLYLELEALGLRGTGIGCYFDDPMHALLGLSDRTFQSVYHFTGGMPVPDARLTTLPAYPAQ